MSKYNSYTALIGILSVFFMLSIESGNLAVEKKIFFIAIGLMVFAHSAWTLYRALTIRTTAEKLSESQANMITPTKTATEFFRGNCTAKRLLLSAKTSAKIWLTSI